MARFQGLSPPKQKFKVSFSEAGMKISGNFGLMGELLTVKVANQLFPRMRANSLINICMKTEIHRI